MEQLKECAIVDGNAEDANNADKVIPIPLEALSLVGGGDEGSGVIQMPR